MNYNNNETPTIKVEVLEYGRLPKPIQEFDIPSQWTKSGDIGFRKDYVGNKTLGEFIQNFDMSKTPRSFKATCRLELTCLGGTSYYYNDCYPFFTGGIVNRCQQTLWAQAHGEDKLRICGMTRGFRNEANSQEIPPDMAIFCEEVCDFGYMPSTGYITDSVDDAIEKVLLGLIACDAIST